MHGVHELYEGPILGQLQQVPCLSCFRPPLDNVYSIVQSQHSTVLVGAQPIHGLQLVMPCFTLYTGKADIYYYEQATNTLDKESMAQIRDSMSRRIDKNKVNKHILYQTSDLYSGHDLHTVGT
jgi:hypothetical protein